MSTSRPIALGARLKQYPSIQTLGFKPDFRDYSAREQKLILAAQKIYYPTAFYADLFNTMGKETFPSFHTYKFALDKIKQTAVFDILGIPHPATKIFYGKRQQQKIPEFFTFPFVAKKPRGSSQGKGVFLIRNPNELSDYLTEKGPAYIQEYLPIDRDMRIVIIGNKIRLAYWRISPPGDFRSNLSQGGRISFDPLPQKALDLALFTASKCGWDDVGIDIVEQDNQFYVLEGNMKYGTKGFCKAGVNYKEMLSRLILNKEI
jgi:ribosomal protein S6--L-glutamate ligase